ncbi:MAG: MFS transporter [Eggerthellaceae bacterium]|nr:MFS transporter [Eggerthellaceae bacterium]
MEKKLASNRVLWLFAIGQLGWSTLSGIISNWLVYFYMPGQSLLDKGHTLFITQTAVFLGFVTIIGLVTALGRVFDAFTDPWIASKSDRCKHKLGRRIPFMRYAAIPFGIITVLVCWAPLEGVNMVTNIWLCVTVLLFYLAMTCYCTPYNALIPELGRTQNLRINVSTFISITYFMGTAFAYAVPTVAGLLEPSMGSVGSFRTTIGILAVLAVIFMLVPAFGIDEHTYADTTPSDSPTLGSLMKTFKNKEFQTFVKSDILYWIALTMFQTGLPFYITELMGLDASWSTLLFIVMTGISFLCYPVVNVMAKKLGK